MNNFVQPGDLITAAAPTGGVVAGRPYLIGSMLGIAMSTVAETLDCAFRVTGVIKYTKAASQAWAVGDLVYWDDANGLFTTTPGNGLFCGFATKVVAGGSTDTTGYVRLNGFIMPLTGAPSGLVSATAATLTVTAAKHAGKLIALNRATGVAVTLPAATGSGNRYDFIVGTANSGGNSTIKVVGDDVMTGVAMMAADGGNTINGFETAADSDTITLDGSTFGGLKGDRVTLIDFAADTWSVEMRGAATGSEASPFSATVT